jgi:outer membrane protein assembly factor BamB/tetratricopeptide (TPR) repeat protein
MSFERPQTGAFTLAFYRRVLEQVIEGKVFTLTVSTGDDERVFFFTRGAILFLAVGTTGGEVLARKILARGLLEKARVDELVKRANSGTPLLQDILREDMILDPKAVASLVEETIEDHLLEVALWDGALALYDLVPGNPPSRLYDPKVPAVRLSVGSKPLLERVLGKVQGEVPQVMTSLGGSLRHRIELAPGAPASEAIAKELAAGSRPISQVIQGAQLAGVPPWKTASELSHLLADKEARLERVSAPSKKDELAQAVRIEDAFEEFVNALLARAHMAAIYERADENEKAAEQYRGIADEHLKRGAVNDGLAALRDVLRLVPTDLGARELIVKVLRGANRLPEAAEEAVGLARALLDQNLPGRARQAFELAIRLVPGSTNVLWMLAKLLELLGEKEEAAKRYEQLAEAAHAANDRDGEVAAYQQVLALAPSHERARAVLRRLGGHAAAIRRRWAAAIGAFLLFLLVVAYGSYEIFAVQAFFKARDQAKAALEEGDFRVASSALLEFQRSWTFSRLRRAASSLLDAIDEEEKVVREDRSRDAERRARDLEAKNQLPKAVAEWRAALDDSLDPARRQDLSADLTRCSIRLAAVEKELERARDLVRQGLSQQAAELVERTLPQAPWLLEATDFQIPTLVDSIPKEAHLTVDGKPVDKPTPCVVERPLTPVLLRLEGRNREPLEEKLEGLAPWPLVLVLPRKPVWRAKDAVASSAPLLYHDLVVVAGLDRTASAYTRDAGTLRWRTSLGIFGETSAPPVATAGGVLVTRARSGTVTALTPAGSVLWSREVAPPGFDPLDSDPGRPVAAGKGVLVREGARSLVLLAEEGGAPVWSKRAESDLVGAPSAAGGLVFAAGERGVSAWNVDSGEPAWSVALKPAPVLGPVPGPKGLLHVVQDGGGIARVSPEGALVSIVKDAFEGAVSAPLAADDKNVFVPTAQGELVALDDKGKPAFRAYTDKQRPVGWARVTTYAVLYGDQALLYVLERDGKESWRHPVKEGAPATADDRQIFQGSVDGLSAYDR